MSGEPLIKRRRTGGIPEAQAARLAAEEEQAARLAAEEAEAARLTAEEAEAARLTAEEAEAARLTAEEAHAAKLTAAELFLKFASYLKVPGDNAFFTALELMFPNSMSERSRVQFITLLLTHCSREPQLVKTATLSLEGPEELQIAATGSQGEYDRGHASDIKFYTGMLFSIENGTFKEGQTIYEFYTLNKPFFNGLMYAEQRFSERIAAMTALNLAIQDKSPPPPPQPLEEWRSITIFGTTLPHIQVDKSTANFILQYASYIATKNIKSLLQSMQEVADVTFLYTIKFGTNTVKVSVYTLLWITKYLYDIAIQKAGWFGSILNWVVETINANRDFLFSGPFQNLSDPDPDESKIRRANRIVFTFFYTMVDLLIFIKENGIITRDLSLNPELQGFFARLPGFFARLPGFFAREPFTWTLDEIFEYGPTLYVAVMEGRRDPGMGYLLEPEYYDSYDKSIGIVTRLLDNRIFDSRIEIESLQTALTPLAIAMGAPVISAATAEQIELVQTAIAKLRELGVMTDDLAPGLRANGWLTPDGDTPPSDMGTGDSGGPDGDGSQSSPRPGFGGGGGIKRRRKTTKRRRKSTRRRKSKRRSYKKTSKRKKGRKSKRRSMREVKDKLIHLINSL